MLAFEAGARLAPDDLVPQEARRALASEIGGSSAQTHWLRLEVPASLEADVDPKTAHQLVLGVAILVGDRYMSVGKSAPVELTTASERSLGASIRVTYDKHEPFAVSLDKPRAAAAATP